MGVGYELKCAACKYQLRIYDGIGFAFWNGSMRKIEAMRNGEYGRQVRDFLANNPNGTIAFDRLILFCDKCKIYAQGTDFTMYIPGEGVEPKEDLFLKEDILEAGYVEFEKFKHRCPNCKKPAIELYDFNKK